MWSVVTTRIAIIISVVALATSCSTRDEPAAWKAPAGPSSTAVAQPAPYGRELYGSWTDADRDGCDTRAEVLMRDMRKEQVRREPSCRVISGTLIDRYTGVTEHVDAAGVDVDHLIALADAHRSGAWRWSRSQRVAFANDMQNLVATRATVNRLKGDNGPSEWWPPDGGCWYAERYLTIKTRYRLQVDAIDRSRVERECKT